jgi:hypothetical protein
LQIFVNEPGGGVGAEIEDVVEGWGRGSCSCGRFRWRRRLLELGEERGGGEQSPGNGPGGGQRKAGHEFGVAQDGFGVGFGGFVLGLAWVREGVVVHGCTFGFRGLLGSFGNFTFFGLV